MFTHSHSHTHTHSQKDTHSRAQASWLCCHCAIDLLIWQDEQTMIQIIVQVKWKTLQKQASTNHATVVISNVSYTGMHMTGPKLNSYLIVSSCVKESVASELSSETFNFSVYPCVKRYWTTRHYNHCESTVKHELIITVVKISVWLYDTASLNWVQIKPDQTWMSLLWFSCYINVPNFNFPQSFCSCVN